MLISIFQYLPVVKVKDTFVGLPRGVGSGRASRGRPARRVRRARPCYGSDIRPSVAGCEGGAAG